MVGLQIVRVTHPTVVRHAPRHGDVGVDADVPGRRGEPVFDPVERTRRDPTTAPVALTMQSVTLIKKV